MNKSVIVAVIVLFTACHAVKKMNWHDRHPDSISGSQFYKKAAGMMWAERDSFAVRELLSGNLPSFFKKFLPIHLHIVDSAGKKIRAVYFVSPDYVSIGSRDDFARIPLTPMAAQKIADSLGCFLPTRKMVNDIYEAAKVKLEPVPMYAFRDS